jgi:hypothetical protein
MPVRPIGCGKYIMFTARHSLTSRARVFNNKVCGFTSAVWEFSYVFHHLCLLTTSPSHIVHFRIRHLHNRLFIIINPLYYSDTGSICICSTLSLLLSLYLLMSPPSWPATGRALTLTTQSPSSRQSPLQLLISVWVPHSPTSRPRRSRNSLI